MIDYNLIHVVNTPITERPNVCIIMNGYSYIAPHGFSVKLKREWLNRKFGFFVEWKMESEYAKELQKKKYGLEHRFDEEMYQAILRTNNSYCNTNFINLSSELGG